MTFNINTDDENRIYSKLALALKNTAKIMLMPVMLM